MTAHGRMQWGAYVEFDTVEHAVEAKRSELPFRNMFGHPVHPVFAVQGPDLGDLLKDLREEGDEDEGEYEHGKVKGPTSAQLARGFRPEDDAQYGLKGTMPHRRRPVMYGSDWGGSRSAREYMPNRGLVSTLPEDGSQQDPWQDS